MLTPIQSGPVAPAEPWRPRYTVATVAGAGGLVVFPAGSVLGSPGRVDRGEGKLLLAPRAFGAPFPCLQNRRPAGPLTCAVCALTAPLPQRQGQGGAGRGCVSGACCLASARILAARDTVFIWGVCYEFPW